MNPEFKSYVQMLLDSAAVRTILTLLILLALPLAWMQTKKYLKKIFNELRYLKYFLMAADKAIAKHLNNGYEKTRDEELKNYLEKDKFINES